MPKSSPHQMPAGLRPPGHAVPAWSEFCDAVAGESRHISGHAIDHEALEVWIRQALEELRDRFQGQRLNLSGKQDSRKYTNVLGRAMLKAFAASIKVRMESSGSSGQAAVEVAENVAAKARWVAGTSYLYVPMSKSAYVRRQSQALAMRLEGKTMSEIAARLGVSIRTTYLDVAAARRRAGAAHRKSFQLKE